MADGRNNPGAENLISKYPCRALKWWSVQRVVEFTGAISGVYYSMNHSRSALSRPMLALIWLVLSSRLRICERDGLRRPTFIDLPFSSRSSESQHVTLPVSQQRFLRCFILWYKWKWTSPSSDDANTGIKSMRYWGLGIVRSHVLDFRCNCRASRRAKQSHTSKDRKRACSLIREQHSKG